MKSAGSAPGISVLLPCYNADRFLGEALRSLQLQTFADFEIIAIDDGSTDGTLELLRDAAASEPRLRLISAEHRGLVATLNEGLRAARGDLIARFDADDLAHATRFERQIALLEAGTELAACGTGVRYFPLEQVRAGARAYEEWINTLQAPSEVARDMFVECPIAHPTLMVRAEALRAVGGYRDNGWPEDYDLILRLFTAGHPLANVPEVLHHWRERADRLSRTDERYSLNAFRRCKVHYLKESLLRGRAVVICGAGPVGKEFARELQTQGVEVRAFVDVDPRKVGQRPHGTTVLPLSKLPRGGVFTVAAVAAPRARQQIRAELVARGLEELSEFCAVA